jgi:sigma-B regulation protein RsbU (phosphoserine phosphatase)
MDQHKLYRTLKGLSDQKFRTDEQLLNHILENIIQNEEISIKGGRIWKFELSSGAYRLVKQLGEIEPIKQNFRLNILDHPHFLQLHRKGTIVGTETNRYLRRRGIRLYSATGIGETISWKGHTLYQYILAINSEYLKHDITYTLNIIGNVLTSTLKNRRVESKAKQLERDIDQARDIQKSILPEHEFRFHNYDLYGISLPERIVGGDFFDYLQASPDKDRLAVVIGDATSKGLSAAAQALYVSGALRMGVEYQTKTSMLVSRINLLVHKTFSPEQFISMVYAELTNSEKGLLTYVNAGHSTPFLFHVESDEIERLPATGHILGPFPSEKYRSEFVLMGRGDLLLLYTDGVTEASNERNEMYGEHRLISKLKELKDKTPKQICQLLLEDVQVHNKTPELSDDKTIVVLKRTR